MTHAIIRGDIGRRHEVDFGDVWINVELYASEDRVALVIEVLDEDRPSDKRRFALVKVPRHLLSTAMADLVKQDRTSGPSMGRGRMAGLDRHDSLGQHAG